jgi:hypothetical protein
MPRSRRTTLLLGGAVVLGTAVSPALATHKKPISVTYTATATTPDPGNFATGTLCDGVNPAQTGEHVHEFAAPEAGTLEVTLTNYQGDWDLAVRNSKGGNIGESGSGGYPPLAGGDEKTKVKIKKAEKLAIVGCNWAGSPTATVKYTFTFAK